MGDTVQIEPNEYDIAIASDIHDSSLYLTLAHELVHVAQHATGRLKDMANAWVKFDDILYPPGYDYKLSPWEIEAYTREVELVEKWNRHINK